MKSSKALMVLLVLVAANAVAAQPDDVVVQVRFSQHLEKLLANVDRAEQVLEQRFRRHRSTVASPLLTAGRLNPSVFSGVKWANEALVGDVKEYGVRQMLSALVKEDIRRAAPNGFRSVVRLTVDRLSVGQHYVQAINVGPPGLIQGSVELVDPDTGAVLSKQSVNTNLVVKFSPSLSYRGTDFAFDAKDARRRVGPVLAYFVKKALASIFPDADLPGPVLIDTI